MRTSTGRLGGLGRAAGLATGRTTARRAATRGVEATRRAVVGTTTLLAVALLLAGCGGPVTVQYDPYTAPDAFPPNDEFYDLQWHYELIDVPEAWAIMRDAGTAAGPPRTPQPVRVAVIDTGIREHEDLDASRLVDGRDFFDDDSDPIETDFLATYFHGTHVTGTVVATTNNDMGVAGLASIGGSERVSVIPLRALSAAGSTFDIAMATLYAVGLDNESGTVPSQPASVINLSLGQEGQPSDAVLYEAIGDAVDAGATVVAASGNDGITPLRYPANYDNTIAVGAVGRSGEVTSYSNTGQELDFTAPGGTSGDGVWSTWDYPCDDPLNLFAEPISGCSPGEFVNLYATLAGTSMATPHVAGVVALLYSYAPELTQDLVYDILLASADDAGDPGHDDEYGHGIVNARAALEYLIRATDDFAVAPTGADTTVPTTSSSAVTSAAADSGPRGRPFPNREGAFLPAGTAAAGRDYDATTVLFSLREEHLSPVELDRAKSRIASEVGGIAAVGGGDPRRLQGTLEAGSDPDIVIQELADHPEVRFAQPNYLYTVPALYPPR